MKIKNITKTLKIFLERGQRVEVPAGETVECNKPVFDSRVFEEVSEVYTEKKKSKVVEKAPKHELNYKEED